MKRFFGFIAIATLAAVLSTGAASRGTAEEIVLKVGATPVPHAELLELVKDDLKAEGITLKVVEFTDYVSPNLALDEGEIDANFFQHKPYLDSFKEDRGLALVSIGSVHVEPLGLYSEKIKSLDDLRKKATIAIPSDSVNGGRALLLLQARGLIKLSEKAGLEATERDVIENPRKLRFKPLEAAQLPRVLPDVDAAVINGNYALEAGLKPTKDAIIIEGSDSPYVNIIAVREKDRDSEALHKLLNALQSDEVRDFILSKYNGGVVPAFSVEK